MTRRCSSSRGDSFFVILFFFFFVFPFFFFHLPYRTLFIYVVERNKNDSIVPRIVTECSLGQSYLSFTLIDDYVSSLIEDRKLRDKMGSTLVDIFISFLSLSFSSVTLFGRCHRKDKRSIRNLPFSIKILTRKIMKKVTRTLVDSNRFPFGNESSSLDEGNQ